MSSQRLLPTPTLQTRSEKQAFLLSLVFLKPRYRCTPWPEIARPTAQTVCQTYCTDSKLWHQKGACGKGQHLARGVRQAPWQNHSPSYSRPGSGDLLGAPPRDPSAISPIAASRTTLSPHRHRRGRSTATRKVRQGLVRAVRLPSIRGNPYGQDSAAPGPARAGRRRLRARGSPSAAHLFKDPVSTRSPPRPQAAKGRL